MNSITSIPVLWIFCFLGCTVHFAGETQENRSTPHQYISSYHTIFTCTLSMWKFPSWYLTPPDEIETEFQINSILRHSLQFSKLQHIQFLVMKLMKLKKWCKHYSCIRNSDLSFLQNKTHTWHIRTKAIICMLASSWLIIIQRAYLTDIVLPKNQLTWEPALSGCGLCKVNSSLSADSALVLRSQDWFPTRTFVGKPTTKIH